MKIALLTLILLLTSNVYTVNGQRRSQPSATRAKIEKLRALEDQLEVIEQLESAEVKEDDKSSTLIIEWKEDVTTPSAKDENDAGTKTQKKTLSINLNELDVPDEYIEEKIAAIIKRTNCGTLPGVGIMQLGVTPDYEVVTDYIYQADKYAITVVKGFIYDRASIPRALWVFLDKDSLGNVAPLIHDLLYRHGGVLPESQVSPYRKFSRKDADELFREILKKCGVSKLKREAAYLAVRTGGILAWKGKD